MSTLERKEYQETRIMRNRSPVRNTRSSTQNLSQFDSNLDNLLEDLQNSVSRPGSSLGQNTTSSYKESSKYITTGTDGYGKTNSLNRVTNVKASNPVTEYSSDDAYTYRSPDGREKVHSYKKEKYMYGKSSVERDVEPERTRMQNSINQLDSLLDDLQQVKKSSYSEKESYNSTGTDPSFQTKTVNRELRYGDTPPSRSRTMERMEEKSIYKKDSGYTSEGTYGDLRPLRTTSPSPSSRTSTLTKQTKVKNVHEYPLRVVETPVPDIDPEVLAHLDPNLHPAGNTKVTTTIKTYTYEIPGSGNYPTQIREDTTIDEHEYLDKMEKYAYSPNETITTPSRSFVYNKTENKENYYQQPQEPGWKDVNLKKSYKEMVQDDVVYYPPYQKPTPPGGYTSVKEVVSTRNYQPGYQPDVDPPGPNQTYVYNESTTTKNIQNPYPPAPPPQEHREYIINKETNIINRRDPPPPTKETREYLINKETNIINRRDPIPPPQETREYIINKETNIINRRDPIPPPETREYIINKETNVINRREPPMSERGYPVYNPPPTDKKTYILKETHTTNYQNGYPPHRQQSPPRDVETFPPQNPPYGRKPQEPINIQYSYKSTNTTQNRYTGGYPPSDETQVLLPRKFPTDDGPDGPPKRIDELMATIGHEPPSSPLNASFTAHEKDLANKKVVENLKQQSAEVDDTQKKDPPTKNVTGPAVYYPPGHEMFAKKEEGGGGWRAQGEYAKGSGKYMYEAESGSKTKTKTGMAVVPVCLPLCCGLPCTLL